MSIRFPIDCDLLFHFQSTFEFRLVVVGNWISFNFEMCFAYSVFIDFRGDSQEKKNELDLKEARPKAKVFR